MKIKVTIDNQTYHVEVEDIQTRPVIALVEGERYEVWPETESSSLPAGVDAPQVYMPENGTPSVPKGVTAQKAGSKDVTAPLPGVIVTVMVKPGDSVTVGQELCTLEAMKMKNAIRSNRNGTIASVAVAVGDQVSHGQALLSFRD